MTHEVAGPALRVRVERVTTPEQVAEARHVRMTVFVGEQGVPVEEEIDALDDDPTTTHLLVRDANGPSLATGRLLTDPADPGMVHVGRVAVMAEARGTGVGALLMRALEDLALAEHAGPGGAVRVELSAQVQAIGFYERLGYQVAGLVYLDAGIEHRDAAKTLHR
jgi:predicted GNAT family N-acyltransferase